MPNKNLTRNKAGSWDSTTEALPSEKVQAKKVVKASYFLEKPSKPTKKTADSASK